MLAMPELGHASSASIKRIGLNMARRRVIDLSHQGLALLAVVAPQDWYRPWLTLGIEVTCDPITHQLQITNEPGVTKLHRLGR